MLAFGPVRMMDGVMGDPSTEIVVIPAGRFKLGLSANRVPGGEKIRIRLDEYNANSSVRQQNILWDLVNLQYGELELVGPGTVGVQRLTHPGSPVSFSLWQA